MARLTAMLLGAFLLVEGIWGLFSPVVFGVLTTNKLHAVIHILLGAAAFLAARSGWVRKYLMFVGALLVVVGIMKFLPVGSDIVTSLLNVNVAVAWFNIIVGAVLLIVAMTDKSARATVSA